MSLRNHADRRNPFADDVSPEDLDAESYQDTRPANPELNTGRLTGKPTDIHNIWADREQPRRAFPNFVAINWDGNPSQVIALFSQWQIIAEQKAGVSIPVAAILAGREGFELEEGSHPYLAGFIEFIRFAQGIHLDGLLNPISVVRMPGGYIVESGERRWLAHHILAEFVDKKYDKIPAIEKDGDKSVWRQARENTARRSLNAIGMARQLALLLMDARAGTDTPYDAKEVLVAPGGCDRRYYAQVANGQVHRIPKGMSEQFISAMNVQKSSISDYRSLLKLTEDDEINDILWLRGDDESWGVEPMLSIGKLPLDTLREITKKPDFTFDDLSKAVKDKAEEDRLGTPNLSPSHNSGDSSTKPTPLPRESLIKGTIIQRDMGDYWRIEDVYAGGNTFYCASPTGYNMAIPYDKITAIANDKADLFKPKQSEPDKRPSLDAWYGIRVQSPGGLIGKVNGVSGMMLNCRTDDGKTFSVLPSDAKLVDKDYQETRVSVDVNTGEVSGDTPPAKGEDPTDNPQQTSSIPQDKHGVPLLEGATVRTRVGRTGRVTGYNGRLVTVNTNGLRTDHPADTLEIIPSDTFLPTPEEKAHIESFLDGDRVRLCRQIGGTAEGAEGAVKVWDDGERAVVFDGTGYYTSRVKVDDQRSHILLWCDLLDSDEDAVEAFAPDIDETPSDTTTEDILDDAVVELLEGLMQAARACDLQQWIILDDLTKLNRKQLRENIARIGIDAVERMTTNYQIMTKEMLMEIEKQFNDHMQRVLMAALEISKDKS